MKRLITFFTLLTLVMVLVVGCGKSNGQSNGDGELEKELVVAGHPDLTDLMNNKVFKVFQEKYPDIKLSYVAGNGSETVAKVKAQKKSPQIDVAILEINSHIDGNNHDVWATIDRGDIPNMSKVVFDPETIEPNTGIPILYSPHVITYNKELVEKEGLPVLTSWNDLTSPELKGKIALSDPAASLGRTALIMLAYANGGSEKEIDPGFDKLATIAANQPTFYKNQSFIYQALQDKSVAYAVVTLRQHHTFRTEANLPLEFIIPKEGTYNSFSGVGAVVKGAKHPNAALEFLDFMLSDEVQKLVAEDSYSNIVTDADIDSEVKEMLDFDLNNIKEFDNDVLSSELPNWLDRFNKDIIPLMGRDVK